MVAGDEGHKENMVWPSFRKWNERVASSEERALVRECEIFMSGRYATFLYARGLDVPQWAWLSELAHAPAERLSAAAVQARRRRAHIYPPRRWQGATSLVAHELVATAQRTGDTLEDIQRLVLLPIELELADPLGHSATDSARLVDEVRRALVYYPGDSLPIRDAE